MCNSLAQEKQTTERNQTNQKHAFMMIIHSSLLNLQPVNGSIFPRERVKLPLWYCVRSPFSSKTSKKYFFFFTPLLARLTMSFFFSSNFRKHAILRNLVWESWVEESFGMALVSFLRWKIDVHWALCLIGSGGERISGDWEMAQDAGDPAESEMFNRAKGGGGPVIWTGLTEGPDETIAASWHAIPSTFLLVTSMGTWILLGKDGEKVARCHVACLDCFLFNLKPCIYTFSR